MPLEYFDNFEWNLRGEGGNVEIVDDFTLVLESFPIVGPKQGAADETSDNNSCGDPTRTY